MAPANGHGIRVRSAICVYSNCKGMQTICIHSRQGLKKNSALVDKSRIQNLTHNAPYACKITKNTPRGSRMEKNLSISTETRMLPWKVSIAIIGSHWLPSASPDTGSAMTWIFIGNQFYYLQSIWQLSSRLWKKRSFLWFAYSSCFIY